ATLERGGEAGAGPRERHREKQESQEDRKPAVDSSFLLPPSSFPKEGLSLYDIAPTVLNAFGIRPPPGMGRNAVTARPDDAYTEEEEAELARRLEDLGYL